MPGRQESEDKPKAPDEESERQRLEADARRLAAIVESSEDAIIGKTLAGIITDWNLAAERMYGYSAAETIGQPIQMLVPPEMVDELPALMERLRRGERIEHYETVRVRKDGRRLDVALSISPIRNAAGEIVGAAKIARDITEPKRLREELQQRVAELAEVDRQKDQFLAMFAHELRNPLNALSNALYVLGLAQPGSPAFARARESAVRQLQHQSRIVDDLLDVSRVNRGKLLLEPERLDLLRVVREVVEDYRTMIERAGVSFQVVLPDAPIPVIADRTRLTQAVGNLLDNAAKFTPAGGVVGVEVEVGRDGQVVTVAVRDTGIGIEAGLLPTIFDPFVQADRSLDRSRGGLGLGLPLTKGIIELHRGQLHVRSEGPGRGTEFRFELPVESELPVVQGLPVNAKLGTGHLRILVVEDNRDAAQTLGDLLHLFGYDVEIAYSGPQGLEAARQFRPQVVLCDIGLPGMDGYQLARELRQNPVTAPARLIALTGYGGEEDRRRGREVGFEEHLTKPVDPAQLQELLELAAGKDPP